MKSTYYVEKELSLQRQKKKEYEALLKFLPTGRLTAHRIKGRCYYYKHTDGKQTCLGSDKNEEVIGLKKRRLVEKTLENMKRNICLMETFLQAYSPTSFDEVMETLPQAYQNCEMSTFASAEFLNAKAWEKEKYSRNLKHPENLQHRTQKGDLVRSKSEVIVANILAGRGIPYHYEELIEVNGIVMAPDFKIAVVSENRFRYLEHCGMISDPQYMKSFLWKLRNYLEGGFVPWQDVFFTFDDLNGNIDAMHIYQIIDNYLT